MEPNHGLTFGQETFLTISRDGNLIAIERQNGHIERYVTKDAQRRDSMEIFGTDKPARIASFGAGGAGYVEAPILTTTIKTQ